MYIIEIFQILFFFHLVHLQTLLEVKKTWAYMISPVVKWGHHNSTHTNQKVSVGQHYWKSSHNLSMKLIWLRFSLKYLYANAHTMGNKRREVEICVQTKGYNLIEFKETWRDSSHGWSAAADGPPFLQEEQTRGGGELCFMWTEGTEGVQGLLNIKLAFLFPYFSCLFTLLSVSLSPVRTISLLRQAVECLFLEVYKPDFTIFWTTCSM